MPPVFTFTGGTTNFGTVGGPGNPNVLTLLVTFKDDQNNNVDVVSSRATIYDVEGKQVQMDPIPPTTSNPDKTLSLTSVSSPGIYNVRFMVPTTIKPGLYRVRFQGNAPVGNPATTKTLTVEGNFELGEIDRVTDYMNRIRFRVMDDFPEDYTLDEPVNQWRNVNLYNCIRDALLRFNSSGPRVTGYTFESFPTDIDELLVSGGVVYAIEGRARLEMATNLNYSDGISLNVQRGTQYLQLAQHLRADWYKACWDWKRATPPRPRGVRSVRVPFRINRVIGLLPGYQTYFSG